MNTMNEVQAAALTPVSRKPHLTVIQGMRRNTQMSLLDELAIHMFGHLHGADFSSEVHDILDARVRYAFLGGSRERLFAQIACAIAVGALFVFSFV